MQQEDLFGVPLAPEPVVAPVPAARPFWTQLAPRPAPQRCSHCVLVAGQRGKQAPPVRTAGWIRMGVLGDTMVLCTGHRDLQREADKIDYPEG